MSRVRIIIPVLAVLLAVLVLAHRRPHDAAAQPTDTVTLVAGCTNVTLTWPAGTSLSTVAAAITPAGALLSIFRFDAQSGRFRGFSPMAPAFANDYTMVTSALEPVFVCMSAAGTLTGPGAAATPTPAPATSPAPTPDPRIAAYQAGFARVADVAARYEAVASEVRSRSLAGAPADPEDLSRLSDAVAEIRLAIQGLNPPPCYSEAHAALLRWFNNPTGLRTALFAEAQRLFNQARC